MLFIYTNNIVKFVNIRFILFLCAVGIVPPRTKSPTDENVHKRNGKVPNGHISRVGH